MLGVVGVTVIETSVTAVTVSVVMPEIEPDAALIVVEPAAIDVARPEPLIAATDVFEELQVTEAVMSWFVLSEKMPVAVNCLDVPATMLGLVGDTPIETSVAGVTVSVDVAVSVPVVAVMMLDPTATAVARPFEAVSLIVAIAVEDELQVTDAVRSWVVLSE